MKKPGLTSAALLSAAFLAACGADEGNNSGTENDGNTEEAADNSSGGEAGGEISLGYNNWAENIAITNMWKLLLEEEGYDVEITMSEKSPIWVGVANGELDAAMEVWLPTTDEPFYEEHEDNIELGEVWFEGTGLGLAVPEYVDINSIEELNDNVDMFDGEIVGIDAGASLTRLTDDAIEAYGLEYEHLVSSEPAMISELDTAIADEEPVVVTMWNPHWVFSDYDIKYLDDPDNVYGDAEDIYYMTRTGFAEDHPEVVEWWNNWEMDDETLGELMSYINEAEDEEEGASQWIEENRDMVDEWIQ
ncbi:glycine betaine ABC transporter substrate-binding protein [Alkalicoccus urumqiensis]|uniref:Glycine/betaine ABC transporter n=1 Tax=Alkalicoccus urumqiensis TaxID=1548213 RepID=A0A2P6MGQ0_ALKUR|nr:glycine betaine ABC transporter substrate-binding protein [Alkalicoccus urumqiensis]PRO65454.1 glycine/betaine ABC transporter [Alkalicoccus urumqiensis]